MRDQLPLARVFRAIARIEQASLDRNKGVVEFRFQEPVAMSIDDLDGLIVGDTNVVRLDPHNSPELLMHLIYDEVPLAAPACVQKPPAGELGGKRSRDIADVAVCDEVGIDVVGEDGDQGSGQCEG